MSHSIVSSDQQHSHLSEVSGTAEKVDPRRSELPDGPQVATDPNLAFVF